MIKTQEWLESQEEYNTKEKRGKVKELSIRGYDKSDNEKLDGSLDLSEFINLEKLDCSYNQLTSLKISSKASLVKLACHNNLLVNLNFSELKPEKLTYLNLAGNDFPEQDLSCFSKFINLEEFYLNNWDKEKIRKGKYNRFYKGLEHLNGLKKLVQLSISNTNIDSGLEYLPDNLEKISCDAEALLGARCKVVAEKLKNFRIGKYYDCQKWREQHGNKEKLSSAQEWLNEKYPADNVCKWEKDKENYNKKKRVQIERLEINGMKLESDLDLSEFKELRYLDCGNNQLTSLKVDGLKKLREFYCINCTFSGSLKFLENLSNLQELNITNTNLSEGLEHLPKSCKKIYCDSDYQYKSNKIMEELDKSRCSEGEGNNKHYNLDKWRIDKQNSMIASIIPLERLYVIRGNIKQFLNKWGGKESDGLSELSKLKSPNNPDELWKDRWMIYTTQFIGRGSAVAGVALTFQDYGTLGGGILAIYPFSELAVSKLEESLKNKEDKWKEFLTDADTFLDNYNELLGILSQFKIDELKEGTVNKAIKDLNERIKEFLKIYDQDGNEEIDIEELTEKRDKLAQDLNRRKNGEVQGIINDIKELENAMIDYRKSSYYGVGKEENNEETKLQSEDKSIALEEENKQTKEHLKQRKSKLELQLKKEEFSYQQIKKELSENKTQGLKAKLTEAKQKINHIKEQLTRTNFVLLENNIKNLMNVSWSEKISHGWEITCDGAKNCATGTWNYLTAPAWYWEQWKSRKDALDNKDKEIIVSEEESEVKEINKPVDSDNYFEEKELASTSNNSSTHTQLLTNPKDKNTLSTGSNSQSTNVFRRRTISNSRENEFFNHETNELVDLQIKEELQFRQEIPPKSCV